MIWNRAIPGQRLPVVAGSFYPQSTQTLRRTVENLLCSVAVQERSGNCGIIAPHAGYAYSGRVAVVDRLRHVSATLRNLFDAA
jgi:AmmeMemoRadiSam system protein B